MERVKNRGLSGVGRGHGGGITRWSAEDVLDGRSTLWDTTRRTHVVMTPLPKPTARLPPRAARGDSDASVWVCQRHHTRSAGVSAGRRPCTCAAGDAGGISVPSNFAVNLKLKARKSEVFIKKKAKTKINKGTPVKR